MQTIELAGDTPPAATVVVLHGLGADGTDFLPMADEIDLSAVGPVRWVLPRAPVRPVTINGGYRMRAWYDILGTDLVRREDEAGLRESFAAVHALVARSACRSALFAGDDVNDEPVFVSAPDDWLTVRVGRDGVGSAARWYLDGTHEMAALLERLLALARGTNACAAMGRNGCNGRACRACRADERPRRLAGARLCRLQSCARST